MHLSPAWHLGVLIKSLIQHPAVAVVLVWPLSSPNLCTLFCCCFKCCSIPGISWVDRCGHQTVNDRRKARNRGPVASIVSPLSINSDSLWPESENVNFLKLPRWFLYLCKFWDLQDRVVCKKGCLKERSRCLDAGHPLHLTTVGPQTTDSHWTALVRSTVEKMTLNSRH